MSPATEFHGCYCLVSCSEKPRHKGQCYIGYTVNANRRIKQHNGGIEKGGAKKTDQRGPWDMVLIIHGFPNNKIALRFEWAWQKPQWSRRLSDLKLERRKRESHFDFKWRVALAMLRSPPWSRLALTVHWINPRFKRDFPVEKCEAPPVQTRVAVGTVPEPVAVVEMENGDVRLQDLLKRRREWQCYLCSKKIEAETQLALCPNSTCDCVLHLFCQADSFLATENESGAKQTLPIGGRCSKCRMERAWLDWVEQKRRLNSFFDV